ncbi:glycosyltransferase family 4 protein [Mongoliimonas terrestris]|uniref:glycosyltransferase family 4 protein n=1 Tax=Mongoliimonas terrestris TaxID=1709001 RepID=UPI0009499ACE|nr:glycosyltransferase family 4 protein [Mongoliimonas terrestris]
MRVLFVSRNFFPKGAVGGAQVSMRLVAEEVQRLGHTVAVLSVDTYAHEGLHPESELQEYRLRLRNLYARGEASGWKKAGWHAVDRFGTLMNVDYSKVLAAFRPDVVNTNVMAGIGPGFWSVSARAGVPIVHTVHDYYMTCIKSSMRKAGKNCTDICGSCRIAARAPVVRPSRGIAEVIYVSEFMKRVHLAAGLFTREAGATIIHGAYRPAEAAAPRRGPVENGRLTIGFFGRISPEKGLDRLIRTLATMPADQWCLRIGGSGDPIYVRAMADLAAGLPVEFLGVQTPDTFYGSVDAVVVSSLWNEPAGRVAYEAGIHGVIPIVAKRGGLPEMIGNGDRGLIFDPDDAESLLGAINQMLSRPGLLARLQDNWLAARPQYDPTTVAQQTIDVYERAIARSRKASVSP